MGGGMIFLIDEDMPRSTARELRHAGYEAYDVRDVGLRGHSDSEVFNYAQKCGAILITGDLGFSNLLTFPLGTHKGIIVVRIPNEISTSVVNRELLRALSELPPESMHGNLVIRKLSEKTASATSFLRMMV